MEDILGRQSGLLIDGAQERLANMSIIVVGMGAIGSWLAPTLAKMGCENVRFFDDDKVEAANFANQIYGIQDIGLSKAEALENWTSFYEPITNNWTFEDKRVTKDCYVSGEVIISAVDSIEVRRELFKAYSEDELSKIWLDARIGRAITNCFAVDLLNLEEVEWYEKKSLFPGEAAAEIPCTEKTFISSCINCAGILSAAIWAYANNSFDLYPYNIYNSMDKYKPQIQSRDAIRRAGLI